MSAEPWGSDPRNRFASARVIDDLIVGIDDFLATEAAYFQGRSRTDAVPAAIGCVPWFNHVGLSKRLANMSACCVVIDKDAKSTEAVQHLATAGHPFPYWSILSLSSLVDAETAKQAMGPLEWDRAMSTRPRIGPVRKKGWAKGPDPKPLLHAKALVLGAVEWQEDDVAGGEYQVFRATRAWIGSSNWTESANEIHDELALWTGEKSLVDAMARSVGRIISNSEMEYGSPDPAPDLSEPEMDDEAFADYAAEWGQEAARYLHEEENGGSA